MPTNLMRSLLAASAIAGILLSPVPVTSAEQVNAVIIKNFDFAPMSLTVKPGATVIWKNLDGEPHTITSTDGLFRSGALDTNETYSFTFERPGTYKYVCSIHPRMTAAVIVK